jgi:hypothetical protein
MAQTIPLSVPDDLLAEVRATAEQTQLSVQDVFRQSTRLGLQKLRESLTAAPEVQECDWNDFMDQPREKVEHYVADEIRAASNRR